MTLDTISVYITTYNGSNATAVTRTSTHYGDLNTVNVKEVPEAQSIYATSVLRQIPEYVGGGSIFLARGTDGALGSMGGSITSLAWPTAYVMISSIAYSTTLSNTHCPSGLQSIGAANGAPICDCGLNQYFLPFDASTSQMGYTMIGLPFTYYAPVDAPDAVNFSDFGSHMGNTDADFENLSLGTWLKEQAWASSLIPNLSQCAFVGRAQGPPGIKIPVSALTATVSTTVQGGSLPTHGSPQPAGSQSPPGPTPTATSDMSSAISPSPSSNEPADSAISIPTLKSVPPQPVPSGAANPGSSLAAAGAGEITPSMPFIEPSGPVMHSTVTAISGPEPQSPSPAVHDGGPTSLPSEGNPLISAAPSLVLIQPGLPSRTEMSNTEEGSGPSVSSSITFTTPLDTPMPTSARTQSIQSPSGEEIPSTQHPIATVAGHTIDFSPQESHIVVHGVTQSLYLPPTASPDSGTAGVSAGEASGNQLGSGGIESASVAFGQTVTPNPMPVIVADKTVTPNGQAITISGTPVSLGSSALFIGTSTVPFPKQAPSAQPIISTLNGDAYTAYPTVTTDKTGSTNTVFGALATISGITIYPTPPGENSPLPTSPNTPVTNPKALITMHGETYTIQNSAVQIAGVMVSEGAPATTISNTLISLGTNHLMIGSSTIPYGAASTPQSAVAITMNGKTYTIQNSAIQVAGVTVSEGAPATTISNTPMSLGPSNFILGSSTISYQMPYATAITINNEPLNLESSAVIVAGSITISGGAPAVTVSGTAILLGSAEIVVGASTLEYSQATRTQSSGDIASAIMSALGRTDAASSGTATPTPTTTSDNTSSGAAPTTSPQRFTGGAAGAARSGPVAGLVVLLAGMGTWLYALGMF